MRPLLVFLAALAVETGHVLAGSRVWQPSASTPQLDRRYFIINTDPGPTESKMIWPNRQLRLCFANDQARAALKDLIIAAHDAWLRRGLGSEFTVVEAGDNECADKRFDTLMVEWSGTNGRMATYVGLPGEGNILRQSNDPDKRPKMVLTTSTSMGMLNQEANVAHELGHAWGLYHEHQNPAFWSRGAISNGQGGTVFGPENGGNWRCENLLDYQDRVAGGGLVVQKPGQYQSDIIGVDMLCKDLSFAQRGRFSAADYLPQPRDSGIATPTGQIDWLSIMLCLYSLFRRYAAQFQALTLPRSLRRRCQRRRQPRQRPAPSHSHEARRQPH